MDETLLKRQKGINVMLYANDTLVSTKTTNEEAFINSILTIVLWGKSLK